MHMKVSYSQAKDTQACKTNLILTSMTFLGAKRPRSQQSFGAFGQVETCCTTKTNETILHMHLVSRR